MSTLFACFISNRGVGDDKVTNSRRAMYGDGPRHLFGGKNELNNKAVGGGLMEVRLCPYPFLLLTKIPFFKSHPTGGQVRLVCSDLINVPTALR